VIYKTRQNKRLGPLLCLKGQVRPSTFKMENLIPQLLFLGQTCPCTYVTLHIGMRLMQKVIFAPAFFLSSNNGITICAGPTDGADLDVLPNPQLPSSLLLLARVEEQPVLLVLSVSTTVAPSSQRATNAAAACSFLYDMSFT